VVVAIVVLSGVVAAVRRGVQHKPDWGDLQTESRYVWAHGHTAPGTAMFGYLPTATFALWPFTTWLPEPVGLVLYVLSNLAALAASVWIVYRYWWRAPDTGGFIWPVLLVCANFQHALQSNQLTLWTLVLCVGGLTLVNQRRELAGGVVLGLAALVKTVPGVLVVYLLLCRRWRALVGVIIAAIVIDVVPSVAFFGWQGAVAEHQAWMRRAGWHSNRVMIEQPLLRVHRHGTNASLAAVLTRWLRAIPDTKRQVILYGDPPADVVERYRAALAPDEALTLDPMPPREGVWAEKRVDIDWVPRFHIADWPPGVVWWLWFTPLALGFAALAWFTWRTRGDEAAGWTPCAALWLLAMFWPSPMTRHYYLAWAFPALVVVWQWWWAMPTLRERPSLPGRGQGDGEGQWWVVPTLRAGGSLAVGVFIAWLVGVACLGATIPRWYGVHLAALALLTAATATAWRASHEPEKLRAES